MTTGVFIILLVATLAFTVSGQDGLCSFCGPNEVTADTLPGYVGPNPFPFKSYTGYVQVNVTDKRNNFYWLVESQSDHPEQDPLVFWYQGGPGCSGLWGMWTENGPFRVQENGNVTLAQFSWNQVANVVFLEQPCGVGFSFVGEGGKGYKSNDQQAAEDNAAFIEGFLQAHPNYIGRDTWLAGESYGGVYLPTLAALILSNTSYTVNPQLVGFMAGNPVIGCVYNYSDVQMNYLYQRSLISYGSISAWNNGGCPQTPYSKNCEKIYSNAYNSIGWTFQEIGGWPCDKSCQQPSLDPDCLYQDFVTGNASLEWMYEIPGGHYKDADTLTANYLSRSDVQQAIGAKSPRENGEWIICGGVIYHPSFENMIPYYQYIINTRPGFHILVYSGDTDIDTVPGPPTQICLATLNGTLVKDRSWKPWFVNGATAGYVEAYEQYTYVTVKAAGHTVPAYQPLTSYNMFTRFLANQTLDGGEIYFPPSNKRRRRRQGDVLREYGVGMAQHFPKN